jgi:hypothetical protein
MQDKKYLLRKTTYIRNGFLFESCAEIILEDLHNAIKFNAMPFQCEMLPILTSLISSFSICFNPHHGAHIAFRISQVPFEHHETSVNLFVRAIAEMRTLSL